MKTYKKILSLLLVAAAMCISGGAQADDAKTMMGGACLPLLPANSPYQPFTQMRVYAQNAHTASLTYVCPVVRDNETVATGLVSAVTSVLVPANATFSCTMRSASEFNVQLDTHTVSHTTAAAASTRDLPFGNAVNVSANNSTYGLSCAIPVNGRVYSYRWSED